jgi:ribosomal protein S18 acetylase RimI-like enzyme
MATSLATLAEGGYAMGVLWVLERNVRAIGFYEAMG